MAQAALNGLFLALSVLPLASEFFPAKNNAATTFRVAAGLSQAGQSSASPGGPQPNLAVFNGNGERLGFLSGVHGGIIGDGEYNDITVTHIDGNNNQPAEYISVSSSGTDALCIAYIGITFANGDQSTFYGDTAQQCGKPWYPSNLLVKLSDGSNPEYKPSCMWIDKPDSGSSGFPQGIGFHVPDFAVNQQRAYDYQTDVRSMCGSKPRLWFYDSLDELQCIRIFKPPIQYNPEDGTDPDDKTPIYVDGEYGCQPGDGTEPDPQQLMQLQQWSGGRFSRPTYGVHNKRDLDASGVTKSGKNMKKKRSSDFCDDGRIVVSDWHGHSARELCESSTSAGPDFYHTGEQLYCNMCTHTLYEICSATLTTNCWNRDTQKIQPAGNQPRDAVLDKRYHTTVDWRSKK